MQTRSGLVWDWASGSDDLAEAQRQLRYAKRAGYSARIVDSLGHGEVVE